MATSDDSDTLRIRDLVERFRAAIEECDFKLLPIAFREFPSGSCGDAALILAKYLKENGQEGFVYVCGMRDGHSHAWLQRDDLIVDITGDQFSDNHDPVCVSRGSAWHAEFEIDRESSSDIDLYTDFTRFNLGAAFDRISRHLLDESNVSHRGKPR